MVSLKKKVGITEKELCYLFDEVLYVMSNYIRRYKSDYSCKFNLSKYSKRILKRIEFYNRSKTFIGVCYKYSHDGKLYCIDIYKYLLELRYFPIFNIEKQQHEQTTMSVMINLHCTGGSISNPMVYTEKMDGICLTKIPKVIENCFKSKKKELDLIYKYAEKIY